MSVTHISDLKYCYSMLYAIYLYLCIDLLVIVLRWSVTV